MFDSPFREGIIHRAVENKLVEINLVNIRDFANDSHRTVDDYQFGGGSGMLMKPEPLFGAVESISNSENQHMPIILMSPQGRVLTQGIVEQLASVEKLVLICGRYEGVDEPDEWDDPEEEQEQDEVEKALNDILPIPKQEKGNENI